MYILANLNNIITLYLSKTNKSLKFTYKKL